jgi:hypothetical protein
MFSHLVVLTPRPIGRITGTGVGCASDARTGGGSAMPVAVGWILLVLGNKTGRPVSPTV